jgi:hypothetical protein
MKNSKLILILESLSQVEITRLEKYVHSPYFHVHKDTVRLFDLLKKRYPHFKEKFVSQERVYADLFPGKPFQKGRLYTLKAYLLKLVYDFLADQTAQTYFSQRTKRDLVVALKERGLHKLVPRILSEGEKELEAFPYREARYHYEAFRFEGVVSDFQLELQNRSREPVLQRVHDGLDRYYLAEKLKYACAMINHEKIFAVKYEFPMLEEVISYCAKTDLEEQPIIGIYYLTLMMQREPEGASYYFQLIYFLDRYKDILPDEEAINLYSFAINFCNRQYKTGAESFLREMFNLFRQMLRQDLVFANPGTSLIYYKNIVTIGLKLEEFAWTERFIRDHKAELAEEHRESMANYSLALLCFQQEKYGQCTRHLLQVDFVDEFNRLNYYILLLKTYYESDEAESLLSLCNTALTYIRRNKSLSANNRTAYRNFVRFVRTMANIRYNGSKIKADLEAEIAASKLLVERQWLLKISQEFKLTTISS